MTLNPTLTPQNRKQIAKRMITMRLIAAYALFAFVGVRYFPPTQWQLGVAIFSTALLSIANSIALFLIRDNKIDQAIQISTAALQIALLSLAIFIKEIGFVIMVATLSLTAITVTNTASPQVTRRAMISALAAGMSAFLLDFVGGNFPFRINLADIDIVLRFGWALVLILLAVNLRHITRQFAYLSMRAKLLLSFTVLTAIFVTILSGLNNQITKTALINEANEALFAAASQTEDSIKDFININLTGIDTEASLPIFLDYINQSETERIESGLRATVLKTLKALTKKDLSHISSYAILDRDGNNLLDTFVADIGSNKSDRPYFIQAVATKRPFVSAVEVSPTSGFGSIYFSAPILDDNNDAVGVVRVRYHATIFQFLLERSNGLVGEDSFGVLFNEYHLHLAHGIAPQTIFQTVIPLDDETFTLLKETLRIPNVPAEELFLDLPKLEVHLQNAERNPDGVEYFTAEDVATGERINQAVVIALNDPPWLLTFFQPQDVFLAPVKTLRDSNILLSLLILMGVFGSTYVLAQVLVRPITRLNEAATQVASGNLDVQTVVTTNDEIGQLTHTFNTMTIQLNTLVTSLETQVADRTKDLENRLAQLQAATAIARDATREPNLEKLLDRATELITDRFGFYHTAIYMVDQRKNFAVYFTGSGDNSDQLKETNHRYKIDGNSTVGFVALVGEPRLALENDPANPVINHPLLPKTRAQLSLPLKVGSDIIGVIDIHSSNPRAFDENDIPIFRSMTDQLAIAIQKNEVRAEAEKTLTELETAYGLYTRESWHRFMQKSKDNLGYKYDQMNLTPIESNPLHVDQAWSERETVIQPSQSATGEVYADLAVPLKVRGEVIGVLNLKFETSQIPTETTEFIEDIAQRLSLVFENARLVETAQQNVEKEKLTNVISNKMRQSLDIDAVLKTAVKEIGDSLGLAEVEIRIGQDSQTNGHTPELPEYNWDEEA